MEISIVFFPIVPVINTLSIDFVHKIPCGASLFSEFFQIWRHVFAFVFDLQEKGLLNIAL